MRALQEQVQSFPEPVKNPCALVRSESEPVREDFALVLSLSAPVRNPSEQVRNQLKPIFLNKFEGLNCIAY
jgi:hypothetical protein